MTIDPRIPTMPGRSTSGFHRPGGGEVRVPAARCIPRSSGMPAGTRGNSREFLGETKGPHTIARAPAGCFRVPAGCLPRSSEVTRGNTRDFPGKTKRSRCISRVLAECHSCSSGTPWKHERDLRREPAGNRANTPELQAGTREGPRGTQGVSWNPSGSRLPTGCLPGYQGNTKYFRRESVGASGGNPRELSGELKRFHGTPSGSHGVSLSLFRDTRETSGRPSGSRGKTLGFLRDTMGTRETFRGNARNFLTRFPGKSLGFGRLPAGAMYFSGGLMVSS